MIRFTVILLIAGVLSGSATPATADTLTVVFTAGSDGKLTACNCPGDPYGGLAERATLIDSLSAAGAPFLLVEAGNMVSVYGDFTEKAACVMRLMDLMGYDAALIGVNELYHGIGPARRIGAGSGVSLLSLVMAGNSWTPVFRPYTIVNVGGVRAGIIAVWDRSALETGLRPAVQDFVTLTREEGFAPELRSLTDISDIVVALSPFDAETNRALLTAYPDIDLVIQGYGNFPLKEPVTAGSGVIVCPGGRGQFAGTITLEAAPDGSVAVLDHRLMPILDYPASPQATRILSECSTGDIQQPAK